MERSLKDPRFRAYVTIAVVSAIALALLWPVAVGRDSRHLSAYDDDPKDVSRFRAELAALGPDVQNLMGSAYVLDDVRDPAGMLLVVVGTERRYDPGEARAVVRFLERGGSVILADEKGFGSDVAREAGFAFNAERVLDTQNLRGDPELVVATARLDDRSFRVLFSSPGSIVALDERASQAEVLASSSEARFPHGSYLDKNGDGAIDLQDQPGPFPLVVRTRLGAGVLVLVADTGPFMNAQVGVAEFENARFLAALAEGMVPRDGTILLDESRHAPGPVLAPYANSVRALARLTSGAVAPLVLLGILAAATLVAWRLTRQTEDWSHHRFDISALLPVPDAVRGDLARAQRMARRRISEKYNISMEQVAAMTTEELLALTGDRTLSEAASGSYRGDPSPLFLSFSRPSSETTP